MQAGSKGCAWVNGVLLKHRSRKEEMSGVQWKLMDSGWGIFFINHN